MMRKQFLYILILLNGLLGQFIDFETSIDLRQIRENDRFYFDSSEEDIDNFFIINEFGSDIEYLEIQGNLYLIIESITESNNEKIVNANAIITNRNDIIMTLKSFSFPISELKSISYNPNTFNYLNSLLEFSSYILVANELDTYELNGGNIYYNMAREITSYGKESGYPNGWNDRWKKCNQIQENIFLRNVKYYFFYAFEDLLNKKNDDFKKNLYLMHESIQSNNEFIGIDNNTKNFLKAYCKDISNYYFKIKFEEGLLYLLNYDVDNKKTYQNYINMLQ